MESQPQDDSRTGILEDPADSGNTALGQMSLLGVLSVILRHRYLVVSWSLVIPFIVVGIVLVLPRSYTASAAFLPQGPDRTRASGFAQMATQFGLELPGGDPSQSPHFYSDVLRSREVLGRLLGDTFEVSRVRWRGDTVRVAGTLVELLELQDLQPGLQREQALQWLKEKAVSTNTDRDTGVVRIRVTTQWPEFSMEITGRLIALVNEFNVGTRRSQATAERVFIEGRVADAERRLREAEDQLRVFLENNRQFTSSPSLVFEHDRLQRLVAMRQQLFTGLSQAYEDVRISEVRNTPVITVVESPEIPAEPDPRNLLFVSILAMVCGAIVGAGHGLGREYVYRGRHSGSPDFHEFERVWTESVEDIRRLARRPSD